MDRDAVANGAIPYPTTGPQGVVMQRRGSLSAWASKPVAKVKDRDPARVPAGSATPGTHPPSNNAATSFEDAGRCSAVALRNGPDDHLSIIQGPAGHYRPGA